MAVSQSRKKLQKKLVNFVNYDSNELDRASDPCQLPNPESEGNLISCLHYDFPF